MFKLFSHGYLVEIDLIHDADHLIDEFFFAYIPVLARFVLVACAAVVHVAVRGAVFQFLELLVGGHARLARSASH